MEWLQNLSDAIAYIEEHLDDEISYERAAEIACCSPNYFQRMFSYVAGISLSDYIRRRRMTQAAFDLQHRNVKVIDVALKYGYTSPTAFNRAFQSVHGISPTSAKGGGRLINAYPPIKFSVAITGGSAMPYRIEEKEAMRVVGIRTPLTDNMEENQKKVPGFWEETLQGGSFQEICQFANRLPEVILGITEYQSCGKMYYYIAAATDLPVPPGMHELEIPAATWAVFENEGHFKETVQSVFRRFLTEWLPFSGYTYTELPNIEVYPVNEERKGHTEVWIAIKKEGEKRNE